VGHFSAQATADPRAAQHALVRAEEAHSERVASTKACTLWVKQEGDPEFFKLHSSAADVDDIITDIAKELPSLKHKNRSALTVHLADVDEKGNEKGVRAEALPRRMTLAAAGLTENASIVVKVASDAVPGTVLNGKSCSAECNSG